MIRLRFRDGAKRRRCYRGLFFDRDGLSRRAFEPKNPKVYRLTHGLSSGKMLEVVPDAESGPEPDRVEPVVTEPTDNPTDEAVAEEVEAPPEPPPVEPVESKPADRFAAARAAKAAKKSARDGSG